MEQFEMLGLNKAFEPLEENLLSMERLFEIVGEIQFQKRISPYLVVSLILEKIAHNIPEMTFCHDLIWHERASQLPCGKVIAKGIKNPVYEITLFLYIYGEDNTADLYNNIREKPLDADIPLSPIHCESMKDFSDRVWEILTSGRFKAIAENI